MILMVIALVFGSTTIFAYADSSAQTSAEKVTKKGKSRIGCRYVWAASGPKKFDCSGFVYWTYKNSKVKLKKKVPRSSCQGIHKSLKKYKVASSLYKAKAGDIILYRKGGRYTHAAISLGKGKIVHASSSKRKVCITKAKNVTHSGVSIIRVIE